MGRNLTSYNLDLLEILVAELTIAFRRARVDAVRFVTSYFSMLSTSNGAHDLHSRASVKKWSDSEFYSEGRTNRIS